MPLVCLEGLSLFRRWTAMHYWLQNTPAMLFHLSSTADCELGFILSALVCFIRFSLCASLWLVAWLCLCNAFSLFLPPLSLSHLPFSVTPSGRLNGRYAEKTPLSLHPSAHYADRELHKTKDKGRQRKTNVEQWEGEIQSNGYYTNCVTSSSFYLTLFWALCYSSYYNTHLHTETFCIYIYTHNKCGHFYIVHNVQSVYVCSHITAYIMILYSNSIYTYFSVSLCSTCIICVIYAQPACC